MTFDQIWSILSKVVDAILIPVLTALGVWGVAQIKRWQAKTDQKTMRENAESAIKAVEQLYPELTGPEKKELGLAWANHLNSDAGLPNMPATTGPSIVTPPSQVIMNEGHVNSLPKTKPPEAVITTLEVKPDDPVLPLG